MPSILIRFRDCFDEQKIYLAPWRVLGIDEKVYEPTVYTLFYALFIPLFIVSIMIVLEINKSQNACPAKGRRFGVM